MIGVLAGLVERKNPERTRSMDTTNGTPGSRPADELPTDDEARRDLPGGYPGHAVGARPPRRHRVGPGHRPWLRRFRDGRRSPAAQQHRRRIDGPARPAGLWRVEPPVPLG